MKPIQNLYSYVMALYQSLLKQHKYTKTFALVVILIFSTSAYVASVHFMPKSGVLLILQLAIVVISMPCSRLTTNISGLVCAIVYNFFFVLPQFSLHPTDAEDIINTMVFLTVAVLTSEFSRRYREKSDALQQAEMRSNILLSVSHDLRTPLAGIIGSLSTLNEYKDQISSEKKQELLIGSIEESHRLHLYIENLLQLVKLKNNAIELKPRAQSLVPVLERIITRCHSDRVTIESDSLPHIWIQETLLEQAIFNIVDNALKYSPQEKPVIIKAFIRNNLCIIQVIDYGKGIPEHERSKIFDVFYSSRTGDFGYGGSGIGLAVSKGIVEAHKGTIVAKEHEKSAISGCIIEIKLPAGLNYD